MAGEVVKERDSRNPPKQTHVQDPKQETKVLPGLPPHLLEAEEYLKSKGWKKMGINDFGISIWQDWMGDNKPGVMKKVGMLPARDGGEVPFSQLHINPVPWTYTVDKAEQCQRQRDAHEEY